MTNTTYLSPYNVPSIVFNTLPAFDLIFRATDFTDEQNESVKYLMQGHTLGKWQSPACITGLSNSKKPVPQPLCILSPTKR